MKRALLLFVVALATTTAWAQGPDKPAASAASSAEPAASAAPAGSAAPAAASALPEGHPPVDEGLPEGHPPTEVPPGHPGGGGGMFQAKPDQVLIDESLPGGTIVIDLLDADDQPLADTPFTLTILKSSVERGDVTERREGVTSGAGRARFDGLEVGSGISYTVSTQRGPARFQSQAFGLKDGGGIRVRLHAYEPTTSLEQVPLVMEATVLIELKEDSFAINHRLRSLNLGKLAFVPQGLGMPLPEGYHAFNSQEDMGGEPGGPMMVDKDGVATLIGTFPPGQQELLFRYQLPIGSDSTQTLRLPLPPRVVHTTVVVGAGPGMTLEVGGFPKAQASRGHNGQRVLQTVRQPDLRMGLGALLDSVEPTALSVTIGGIPTPGPWRWIAVLLAAAALGGGVYYLRAGSSASTVSRREQREDLLEAERTLLEEIANLERLHQQGEVGPKSYERLRVALLDALARIMSRLEEQGGAPYRAPGVAAQAPARGERISRPRAAKPKASNESVTRKRKKRKKRVRSA